MYIVNTSFMVEVAVHAQWYDFFVRKFIPYLREAGFGSNDTEGQRRIIFTRVLTDNGDPHYTYSLQIEVPDTGEYQRFMQDMMSEYSTIARPLFGDQALHFTSLLKKIDI